MRPDRVVTASAITLLSSLLACGGVAPSHSLHVDDEEIAFPGNSRLDTPPPAPGICDSYAEAGGGWANATIPESTGSFEVRFRAYPSAQSNAYPPTIDGVIALSRGLPLAVGALGPAVHFNPDGYIEARDGSAYTGAFPYVVDSFPYEFEISIQVYYNTYSVWARHLDSPNKPFQQVANSMSINVNDDRAASFDTVSSFVYGVQGTIETCGLTDTRPSESFADWRPMGSSSSLSFVRSSD
jgi:hypothetical protein